MTTTDVLRRLRALGSSANVEGMRRYGIVAKKAYGVAAPATRSLAKEIGRDHALALKLWKTEVLEARAVATLIADPKLVDEALMERWARDFDNWAVCDGACTHLFRKSAAAWKMPRRWARRKEEFVKRAGFAMIAGLTVHDKKAPDAAFEKFFPLIVRHSTDERVYVKKAVNWALRQIGKRNAKLCKRAIAVGEEIHRLDSSSAKWIASDALRELRARLPKLPH
jgi:3-methyladenine DNA glycosylase AlkD